MIALARKYRPKQFADLIVQDHVAAALRGAVAQGRVLDPIMFEQAKFFRQAANPTLRVPQLMLWR